MPTSVMKYLSIRSGSMPEKPRSIMRLTASGTASVAAAETTSAARAAREHPLVAQQIGPQAEQRAQARRACQRLRSAARHRCRSRRSPPSVCGVTSCTNKGPAYVVQAQTLRARAA